ncbi:porin [Candidatus Pelagibacter sp.]|nr:porin [Candidatus Pelagibacter sp.]
MNIKKIGMTALAASLVSTSVFAGELTATGSASITVENYSGEQINTGKAFSMADSVTLNGSTELDNGMTVSMSFELEGGGDAENSFDDHSVTISSDALGTFKFSGNGGSTAVSALDATAAGDIFDNFDAQTMNASATAETTTAAGTAAVLSTAGGNNTMLYTLPSVVDGLSVSASYTPQGSSSTESSTAFGATYTGVEGLSVSYGSGTNDAGATDFKADVTTMKASYAYGPITVAYSDHEFDSATATRDQDTTSYSIAYTVSDAISISYGTEEIDSGEQTVDAEYSKISASYTAGGLTVTAVTQEAENISYTTATTEDQEYWGLTLGFAF